jgi:predicted nuclease of restriction endonuclease-like (RecB) superfamily
MSQTLITAPDYQAFIREVKQRVQSAQIKAAVKVNQELLGLYWYLGGEILAKQESASWGDRFLEQMSKDLQSEFPSMKGFSKRNLELIRQWYRFWSLDSSIAKQPVSQLAVKDSEEFGQQLIAQIPWGHNVVIISKIKELDEAQFYVKKTIQNNWSRAVLTHQIESGLYHRDGKSINNFQATLPKPHSDLAQQTLKDPYNFDFLMLREEHDERELESALVEHITKFLVELGAGFSFAGRQYKLEVAGDEFFIDLLFYHLKLRCFVVVELKTGKFKPEYAGKLNFYCNVIDDKLKHQDDKPTIGLILCQDKKGLVAEYALKGIDKPIGVSEYQLTKSLPQELRSSLPSVEEIEAELGGVG